MGLGLRHEAAAHRALARATAGHVGRHRVQAPDVLPRGHADEHLLDHAAIQRIPLRHGLEGRQGHFARRRPHARSLNDDLAAAQHDLAADGAGPTRRPIGLVGVPWATDRGAILLEHGTEDLQARSRDEFQQLGPRID